MNVELTKDLEDFIAAQIDAAGYRDPGEVVRDALRHLRALAPLPLEAKPELGALLLQAIQGPYTPYSRADLETARDRILRSHAEAA